MPPRTSQRPLGPAADPIQQGDVHDPAPCRARGAHRRPPADPIHRGYPARSSKRGQSGETQGGRRCMSPCAGGGACLWQREYNDGVTPRTPVWGFGLLQRQFRFHGALPTPRGNQGMLNSARRRCHCWPRQPPCGQTLIHSSPAPSRDPLEEGCAEHREARKSNTMCTEVAVWMNALASCTHGPSTTPFRPQDRRAPCNLGEVGDVEHQGLPEELVGPEVGGDEMPERPQASACMRVCMRAKVSRLKDGCGRCVRVLQAQVPVAPKTIGVRQACLCGCAGRRALLAKTSSIALRA